MCYLRIKVKQRKLSLLNIHAPTEVTEENKKDEYYETMEREMDKIPRYDVKIVLGDANAKIGKERRFFPTIGEHSKHSISNNNGERLIDFASGREMKICSTYFQRKEIHKATWTGHNRQTANQVDHVLVDSKHMKRIKNVKTCRGAEIGSDHYLVKIEVREEFHSDKVLGSKKSKIRRLNYESLQEEKTQKRFIKKTEELLAKRNHNTEGVDEKWNQIAKALKEAARETLPAKPENVYKNNWMDEECWKAVEEKKRAR